MPRKGTSLRRFRRGPTAVRAHRFKFRLPHFATLQGYEQNIEWSTHRWCGYWGRGI